MLLLVSLCALGGPTAGAAVRAPAPWCLGTPIVTYWAGPPMTDGVADQMAQGGFNLVWCAEKDLDVAARHRLRAQLQDPLLTPAALDDPAQREKLDALITRVKSHPALYSYFITDEPNAAAFTALGRLVAYLRLRDPAHLAYINLFPTYATNEQLGNQGDVVTAYRAHLRQYIEKVKPGLISYDHYQFSTAGDNGEYFLNLALIREAALEARLPFLNIVQACTWTPSMRVPKPDEMRYLVYTSLAYGAQGISYYVYCYPGHTGGIANADGTPTPIYHALKSLNREFAAIAGQLQPLRSAGVFHAGCRPQGTEALPAKAAFTLDPPVPAIDYKPPQPVKGLLLGLFSPPGKPALEQATHAVIVNLDYAGNATAGVRAARKLEVFDPVGGKWKRIGNKSAEVELLPGGGKLLRLR